jgi:hypothetical protein
VNLSRTAARAGGAAQQGDEADEVWSTSELRSLSPVFDDLSESATMQEDVTPESLPFIGQWRITWMELWAQNDVDLDGPAVLEIGDDLHGEISFLCVQGWLDCQVTQRDGKPAVEFSWEGADDGEPKCGRGWLRLSDSGDSLDGFFHFHRGDSSTFKAERVRAGQIPPAHSRRTPRRYGRRRRTRS